MKKLLRLFGLIFPLAAFGAGLDDTLELLNAAQPMDTNCASTAFANGLKQNAEFISQDDSETDVKNWIYDVFQSPDVLSDVLECPEVMDTEETVTIQFQPIQYKFPNGRELIINYATQPKLLEQRFTLGIKTELPTDDPSPEVSANDPNATWVNTNPAWYGIMVVQAGAFDEFVGPDRNNTISQQYILDNYEKLYPKDSDGTCTTRSGMGAQTYNSMVHEVLHEKTAKHDDDKNNYYIAGDINLQWISFAEIALEVVMTAVSFGGFAAVEGGVKAARAMSIMSKLTKNMRALIKSSEAVKSYIRVAAKLNTVTRKTEQIKKFGSSLRKVERLEKRLSKVKQGTKKFKRLEKHLDAARKLHVQNATKLGKEAKGIKSAKDADKLKDLAKNAKKEAKEIKKTMKEMAKADKNVKEYVKQTNTLREVAQYVKDLKAFRKARTGNVLQRTWQGIKNTRKSLHAARSGTKILDKADKVARRGAKFINKVNRVSKTTRTVRKAEKELSLTKNFSESARNFERVAQSHLDEMGKLGRDELKAVSKLDPAEAQKLVESEREAVKALNQARKEVEEIEEVTSKVKNIEKQLDTYTKGSKEYENAVRELESITKNRFVQELSSGKQKKLRQAEELKKLHQEANTIKNKAGKGLKEAKQLLNKERDLAKLRYASKAKKVVNSVEATTKAVSGLKRVLHNLGTAFKHSMGGGAVRDWLYHSTLRNAGRVAHIAEDASILSFALGIAGDFFDYTATETDEFTNGVNLKPYLLLSADAIEGQDNVVNFGMWMMWTGDSFLPQDDDAAYLQATDFAQKFYHDLVTTQKEKNRQACNVDIYVVRPIIRNPDTDNQALYWLIMNDEPWSTDD